VILAAAQKTADIALPVAITVFPAWEQAALLASELRAAFRPLRPAH
jgi:hypothetical protein